MQILHTHKAYPTLGNPDLFTFADGTKFFLEVREDGLRLDVILVIQTAVSRKRIEMTFTQTMFPDHSSDEPTKEEKEELLAKTLTFRVAAEEVFPIQFRLFVEADCQGHKRSVNVSIHEFAPADFYTTSQGAMTELLLSRFAHSHCERTGYNVSDR